MSSAAAQTLWVYGPPGVGKSTTAWMLYERLVEAGTPSAYVDVDQIGMCYPEQDSDPVRNALKARAAGQVLRNFITAGATRCVVSGVLDPYAFDVYAAQLTGLGITFCRLTVEPDELHHRNLTRGGRDEEALAEALLDAADLNRRDLGHPVIDTQASDPRQVTDHIAAAWQSALDAGAFPSAPTALASLDPGAPTLAPGRVVFICGPAAVGKSSVGWEVFSSWLAAGRTTAFVDLAQIGFLNVSGIAQPELVQLKAANLAALWSTFADAGADHLVVNGEIASALEAEVYRAALPKTESTIYRLTADAPTLRERVYERGLGLGPPLAGDRLKGQLADVLDRAALDAAAQAEALKAERFGDQVLDTTHLTVAATSAAIADRL